MEVDTLDSLNLSKDLADFSVLLAKRVRDAGGRAVIVGGSVRDALLGAEPKDIDFEVFGMPVSALEKLLCRHYKINLVGRSFGVFKVRGVDVDISMPRRESKQGVGHKGFKVEGDPDMSFEDAALRRDFTINAISWDPLTHQVIDPCSGVSDLNRKCLRHTSEQFAEDPLRVLRAMQFLARFEFTIAPETMELCRSIVPETLPKERLFEEWSKLMLKGRRPSLGLHFLKDCGWIQYYPELACLVGCEQEPQWHPEGDVWVHTLHCMDAFARKRIGDAWEDLIIGFAVLCHDLGKPATTFVDTDGRIKSPNHEVEGVEPTRQFMGRLTAHKDLVEAIVPLVLTHLRPAHLCKDKAGDSAVRRLAKQVGRIDRLLRVCEADMAGRPPKSADFPAGEWLLQRAEALRVKEAAPKPIVMGRHLMELGVEPGPRYKQILNGCYEAQLEGQIADLDAGITFAKTLMTTKFS